jgi:hypothetical protein
VFGAGGGTTKWQTNWTNHRDRPIRNTDQEEESDHIYYLHTLFSAGAQQQWLHLFTSQPPQKLCNYIGLIPNVKENTAPEPSAGLKFKKKTINFCAKLSFVLSFVFFFLSASNALLSVLSKPCALNAEFQHFILRFFFVLNSFTLRIPLKEEIGSERRPKDTVKKTWLLHR